MSLMSEQPEAMANCSDGDDEPYDDIEAKANPENFVATDRPK